MKGWASLLEDAYSLQEWNPQLSHLYTYFNSPLLKIELNMRTIKGNIPHENTLIESISSSSWNFNFKKSFDIPVK